MLIVRVNTCYGETVVPVRLLGPGVRENIVWVQAVNGSKPWTRQTHGGPSATDTAMVFADRIEQINQNSISQGE